MVKKILVIDDNELFRDMLAQLLTQAGYETAVASDGQKGVRLATKTQVDLVVTDIIMPEKEGLSTIQELRKMNPTIPIIAVSGGGRIGSETYLTMAKEFGARYIFQKPFDNKSLLAAIDGCFSAT
jgi:DNA-binding response OmpR family regulator